MNATTPEKPVPTGDVCYIRIDVFVPRDRDKLDTIIEKVNRESGLDDSGFTYQSFLDPDTTEFDVSEFAFWLLENRMVSDAAADQVVDLDYDVQEVY